MKIRAIGFAAIVTVAIIGLTGCETTVVNPPAVSTHTTTVLPGKHTTTVVHVPGPSSNTTTNTNTTTEKTTVIPEGSDSAGETSSTTHTEKTTTQQP